MLGLLLLLVGSVAANLGYYPTPDYKKPENYSIPSVLYVSPSILSLYGLSGSYGPTPPQRPTEAQINSSVDKDLLEKFLARENDTKPATLGFFIKSIWEEMKDETTKNYFQWVSAHVLNALFAAHSLRRPIEVAAMEAHFVAMGICYCPKNPRLGVTFPRVCEANGKNDTTCEVTRKEARRALDVVENLAHLNRYWIHVLNALSADEVIPAEWDKDRLAELMMSVAHGASFSDEYRQLLENYQYLLIEQFAAFRGETVEQFLASIPPQKIDISPKARGEEKDEDDVDVDGSSEEKE